MYNDIIHFIIPFKSAKMSRHEMQRMETKFEGILSALAGLAIACHGRSESDVATALNLTFLASRALPRCFNLLFWTQPPSNTFDLFALSSVRAT